MEKFRITMSLPDEKSLTINLYDEMAARLVFAALDEYAQRHEKPRPLMEKESWVSQAA